MLRVSTYLAPSRIAGVGLFSSDHLPTGTRIWEYTEGVDWKMTADELSRFPEPFQSRMRHYVYLGDSGLYVLCGDNARFMNHSFTPNCDDSGSVTTAFRNIEPGEELTCDYRGFDEESRRTGLAEWLQTAEGADSIVAAVAEMVRSD